MMVDSSRLTDTLQTLVDARLDTVDRMLIGRVNRQDRLAIVREVESQVLDLIERHGSADLDREDILAILGRLDPPEAYLPEESSIDPRVTIGRGITRDAPTVTRARGGKVAFRSGVLGLVSIGMVVMFGLLMLGVKLISSQTVARVLIFGTLGSIFVSGLLAIVFAAYARFQGAWSIVGLVTGIVGLVAGFAEAVWLASLLI